MKNKVIALVLALTLLSGTCVYALPPDLWEYESRFESIYTVNRAENEFYMVHKIIDYIGVANKEDISGDDNVKPAVILGALAEIAGLKYGEDVENAQMLSDLKAAKYLREDAKTSLLSMKDLLYAAARITGWAEVEDIDAIIYAQAKKSGLLRNLEYSSERNLTKNEAAQLIYNTLSVQVKKPKTFEEGVTNLDKETLPPLLESKYGIVLKKGIVTSVFGESIFSDNRLKADEIEIDSKKYHFNTDESRDGLVGRYTAFFMDVEDELVIFIEPTSENVVYEVNYNPGVSFKSTTVEYEVNDEELYFEVNPETIVVYNGISVGTYSAAVMNKYYGKGSKITAIDNDDDGICDVLLIRKWEAFTAKFEAGTEGTIVFDYNMKFNGQNYIDVTPDDKKTHITILRNGVPDDCSQIKAGDIVSISSSANTSDDKYIIIELGYEEKVGVLNSSDDNVYVIDGTEYYVSDALINAQKTDSDVTAPEMGGTYVFYIDAAGQVANVNVPLDYQFGYLVKLDIGRGLEPECNIKIFTSEGKMITVSPAKKVVLNRDAVVSFTYNQDHKSFINKIVDEAKERAGALYNGDYRSIIQYKLNGKGELEEMWLPIDNTAATSYGKTGYQLTKDVLESGKRTFYGVVWGNGMFRLPATSPIFKIPGDLDAKDALYSLGSINQTQYNDTLADTMEFYSVNDFNIVGAAVIRGASGEGDINSYDPLMIVDKVVSGLNADKEPITKVYGWLDGKYMSYATTENSLASDADSGWEVVNFEDLKFGDIIQVYESNGDVRRFRVVYRASNPGTDRIQVAVQGTSNDGNSDGETVSYGTIQQMVIATGNYVDRELNVLKIRQDTSENLFFMRSNKIADVYVIDTTSKKVTISSTADLKYEDDVMLRGTWGGIDAIYVVR